MSDHSEQTMPRTDGQGPGRLRLLVIGLGSFHTYALPEAGELTIGRSDAAFVRIEDAKVSRKHAVLAVAKSGLRIRDLGSQNGTLVRESRVPPGESVEVRPGDVIDIGHTMLIVQQGATAVRPRHLWGHGVFEGRIEDECARAGRTGSGFAVVRLHIDGPTAAVEEILAAAMRAGDPVAAYGPSQYELLLLDVTPDQSERLVQQLLARLESGGTHGRAGLACWPRDGKSADALAQHASSALRGAGADHDSPVVVEDGAMQRLHRLVERVAAGQISVLLLGETGVGKEVFAETIHARSPRAGKPFVRLNCAALAETLIESELFGHERGAFTGAVAQKQGLLETASSGTVFLDEIGDLRVSLQAKLLRVLEEKRVTRLGGTRARSIDVRFIAATNRDLEADVESGRFRRDLYFRLSGISLMIPPLRERRSEIEPLARAFLRQACAGRPAPEIDPEALTRLSAYDWPGNIRELRNVMERALVLCGGDAILAEHLPVEKMGRTLVAGPDSGKFPQIALDGPADAGDSAERRRIVDALERCAGNQTQAAKLLGMSRRTLVSRLQDFAIPRPRKRD